MTEHVGTTNVTRKTWTMKMITILVLGILAAAGVLISSQVHGFFEGNPRQRMQCKNHAQTYLREQYPFLHVAELQSGFNRKMGTYFVSVTADVPEPVEFFVQYDSTGKFLSDNYIEKKLELDISHVIAPILQQTLPEVDDVDIVVHEYPDQVYENNIVFHHDVRVDCRVVGTGDCRCDVERCLRNEESQDHADY